MTNEKQICCYAGMDEGRKRVLLICGEHPGRSEIGAVRWRAEGASDDERNCGRGAMG